MSELKCLKLIQPSRSIVLCLSRPTTPFKNMNISRYLIFIVLTSVLAGRLFGQSDTTRISKNTFYVELLGNGGFYSVNYDRILFVKNKFKISVRFGLVYYPPPVAYNQYFSFPAEANFFYGNRHNIEIAIGGLPVVRFHKSPITKIYDSYCYTSARIVYRFQRLTGGWFLRTGIIAAISTPKYLEGSGGTIWTIGIGIGYSLTRQ